MSPEDTMVVYAIADMLGLPGSPTIGNVRDDVKRFIAKTKTMTDNFKQLCVDIGSLTKGDNEPDSQIAYEECEQLVIKAYKESIGF